MNYIGRDIARLVLHDREHCHCAWCWPSSRITKAITVVGPWIAFAAVLYIIGHICVWAVNQFPGLTRVN